MGKSTPTTPSGPGGDPAAPATPVAPTGPTGTVGGGSTDRPDPFTRGLGEDPTGQ
jgi:hypothetical protein